MGFKQCKSKMIFHKMKCVDDSYLSIESLSTKYIDLSLPYNMQRFFEGERKELHGSLNFIWKGDRDFVDNSYQELPCHFKYRPWVLWSNKNVQPLEKPQHNWNSQCDRETNDKLWYWFVGLEQIKKVILCDLPLHFYFI